MQTPGKRVKQASKEKGKDFRELEKDKKTLDATTLAAIEGHRILASFRRFFYHQKKE